MKIIRLSLIISIVLASILNLAGCSFSKEIEAYESSSTSKISIGFTEYQENMEKNIPVKGVQDTLYLEYSEFELEQGEFVIQIIKENEVIYEVRLEAGNEEEGVFAFEGLAEEIEYNVRIYCENAVKGNIDIEWSNTY